MTKAVALKYPEGASAPFITAKGSGKLAEIILEEAKKNDVYVENNSLLVDLLSEEDIGESIPETAYEALAVIFACMTEK